MAQQVVVNFLDGSCSYCDQPSGHCGLSISGSVGRGGVNRAADVKAIQSALNNVDPADGGPTLRLAVDGIAGPLTIAAIEKYQRRQIGWADGRVDPNGPTIHCLQGGGAQKGLTPPQAPNAHGATPPPKATAAQNKAFIERVGGLLPQARHWATAAQMKIDFAADYMNSSHDPGRLFPDFGHADYKLMSRWFHIDKLSRAQAAHAIHDIRQTYRLIQEVITESLLSAPMFGWGVGYFQPDPHDGTLASAKYVAYTFFGGWHQRRKDGTPRLSGDDNYDGDQKLRQDTIFFPVGHVLTRSDRQLTKTIVHELAHFVGPGPNSGDRIGDHTYAKKPNFLRIDPWTARHTADIYGYFAAEAALGTVPIPIT